MLSKFTAAAALSAVGGLLVSCSPAPTTVVSTPTPTQPTFLCTPEAGGKATPCSESEHAEMLKKDALYAEAEKVYREFFEEDTKLFNEGKGPSAKLLALTDGEVRQEAEALHRSAAQEGRRSIGKYRLAWIRRNPGEVVDGSVVSLLSCIDASQVRNTLKGKDMGDEGIWQEKSYFARRDDRLVFIAAAHAEVPSC